MAAAAITTVFRYLIAAYALAVEWSHHAGAIRNAYRDLNPIGSPRRAAWPVCAIAREICVHSSSSVKIVGDFRTAASQKRIDSRISTAIATGIAARNRSSVVRSAPSGALT